MSWYNTVVLSFSSGEWDEETLWPPPTFKPLKLINRWLKKSGLEPLCNMGKKCDLSSNAVLFGGSYDGLDLEEFCKMVAAIEWRYPDDVQMLYWGDDSDKFTVIEFPLA